MMAFLALAMIVTAAQAPEPRTGSLIPAPLNMPKATHAEAVAQLHDMANCAAHSRRSEFVSYLAAPEGSDATRKAESGLVHELSLCLETVERLDLDRLQLSMSGRLLRGAVAEALLRVSTASIPAPAPAIRKSYDAPWMSVDAGQRAVDQMAACVVDMHPQPVSDLLATTPASAAESAAFGSVTPYLGACLVRNVTLTTDAAGLRAALAEALYHHEVDFARQPNAGGAE